MVEISVTICKLPVIAIYQAQKTVYLTTFPNSKNRDLKVAVIVFLTNIHVEVFGNVHLF